MGFLNYGKYNTHVLMQVKLDFDARCLPALLKNTLVVCVIICNPIVQKLGLSSSDRSLYSK